MTARRRVSGIDQLRGLAIALVMLRHAWPSTFQGAGIVGVVMFFTLSGHLITGILLDELDRSGRVGFGAFYLRRARRLLPALLVVVLVVVVVTLVADPLDDRDQLLRTVLAALTFTGDLPFGHGSDATFHLWTLATEEQFYLVWPALLLLAHRRGRVVPGIAAAGVLTVAAAVFTAWWFREDPVLAYALPTPWAICFVVGAAAQVRVLHGRALVPRPRGTIVLVLLVLAALSLAPLRDHSLTYVLGAPLVAALTAVLLLDARARDARPGGAEPPRLLRACAILGTVSYGAYLWNYPLTLWLSPELGAVAAPVVIALTLLAAALSWRWIEQPAMRLGRRRVARPEAAR